jgi:predicted secreted protein
MKTTRYSLLFFILLSCNGTETSPESLLSVELNETLTLKLKSNATTGYKWFLFQKPVLVDSVERRYTSDFGAGCTNGAGGTETWEFKGLKRGIDTLRFIYARNFNEEKRKLDETDLWIRKYVVEVK